MGTPPARAALAAQATQQRLVVIHVFDELRKTSRDFSCARGVLLDNMRYFRAFLNESNELDEIDISVHCDVEIFELLVEHMHHRREPDWRPRLALDNIASILVSAEFLQMDDLVDECAAFISARLQDFVMLRVDLSCLSDASVVKIAEKCSAEQLHRLQDPKDKLQSKLQRKKVDVLVKQLHSESGSRLQLCRCCHAVYTQEDARPPIGCRKSKRVIGMNGELSAQHQPTAGWQAEPFLRELVSDQSVTWTGVYWYTWAATNWFDCSSCHSTSTFLELHDCAYHPGRIVGQGADSKYSCCSSRIFNIDEAAVVGCKKREHSPAPDDSSSTGLESMKSTLPSVWEQVAQCAAAVQARSSSSSNSAQVTTSTLSPALPGAIDVSSVFSDLEVVDVAIDPQAAKKPPGSQPESSSSACRRQWRIMQRQERDRVRMQQLTRRLLLQRKSTAS